MQPHGMAADSWSCFIYDLTIRLKNKKGGGQISASIHYQLLDLAYV